MPRIQPEFDAIRGRGVSLLAFNEDALSPERRGAILDQLAPALGERRRCACSSTRSPSATSSSSRRRRSARRPRGPPSPRALGIDEARARRGGRSAVRAGRGRARGPHRAARVPGRRLHRGRGPAADDPRHGDEPARLGAGACTGAGCSPRRPRARADQRRQRGRLEGLRRGGGGQGRARVDQPRDRGRDGALRHPLERRPGRGDGHPRAAPHPGQRPPQGAARRQQPVRPPDHAGGRGPGDPPALPAEAAWINGEVIRVDGGEHVSGASR